MTPNLDVDASPATDAELACRLQAIAGDLEVLVAQAREHDRPHLAAALELLGARVVAVATVLERRPIDLRDRVKRRG